jgi:hypothetical protein
MKLYIKKSFLQTTVILITICGLSSCDFFNLKGSCEIDKQHILEIECLQIFENLPTFSSPFMNSEGIHLESRKHCICRDDTRWLNSFKHLLAKGDTIIKRKGELEFSIHKKDTVIVIKWECNDDRK